MSDNNEPENAALRAAGVSTDYESSQDNFQPVLRQRRRQRLASTQATDHDYVNAAEEPELEESEGEPVVDVAPVEQPEVLPVEPAEQPEVLPVEPAPNIEEASGSNRATETINLDTPSPPKKRKRSSPNKKLGTPVVNKTSNGENDDDEDDGMTCPICLDSWEMSGEHRLVSLRCGHLFGESCIKRWLNESMRQSAVKVCPQCKAKATNRDLRHLYAKRLRAIDRSEEHRLRDELDSERRRVQGLTTELATAKMTYTMVATQLQCLQIDNARLREMVRAGGGRGAFAEANDSAPKDLSRLTNYRLYMEKNFEITSEPGCRVLLHSEHHAMLVASQKSAQSLFPGYGVRFIDLHSFKPQQFLHTSAQLVRDLGLSADQNSLVVASREPRVKLFDLRSRQCSGVFAASDRLLWSCSMDRSEREHFLYVGDLRGSTYVYDVRFPDSMISEFHADENFSPVIHIAPVPAGKTFTSGGFLVCQLTALTFYEYCNESAQPTRLNVEGPFLSMQYDMALETVLVSVRSNQSQPQSRFLLGRLDKIDGTPVLHIKATIFGSKATPIMTRCAQLGVESNTLVVGYLQDNKQLIMHDVRREERVQTLPVNEVVYDICPFRSKGGGSYLAALTDNKCRIYKVSSWNMS